MSLAVSAGAFADAGGVDDVPVAAGEGHMARGVFEAAVVTFVPADGEVAETDEELIETVDDVDIYAFGEAVVFETEELVEGHADALALTENSTLSIRVRAGGA